MPDRATMLAATPTCPCYAPAAGVMTGEPPPCDRPMRWHHARGVWVCPAHPHMEVRPESLTIAHTAPPSVHARVFEAA